MKSVSEFITGGDEADMFEKLLTENYTVLERFVKFKVSNKFDAEDIIQDTALIAYRKFDLLRDKSAFKPWLLSIARNRCTDYYREKARRLDIPLDSLTESSLSVGRYGVAENSVVHETLDLLGDKDKQILYLYFFKDLPLDLIAQRLDIPIGTVKSRLHYAKKSFKEKYPLAPTAKGAINMKKLPEFMPEYKIRQLDAEPFPVRWEEIMGWFIVPRLGEKLSWAMYDFPEKKRTEYAEIEVVGRAEVHGIEGVEIVSVEYDPMDCNSAGGQKEVERHLVAQLTDTHCRILSESHKENGIKKYYTFLDGDPFLDNWGFGENNCGNEVDIAPKGDIVRDNGVITAKDKKFLLDVVGRYEVEINGKCFDTVCVIDCYTYIEGAMTEQYIDKNGKTVLWRRFNRDDWAFDRYKKKWTEILPDNETLTVNGITYVHWYDCLTDYIF